MTEHAPENHNQLFNTLDAHTVSDKDVARLVSTLKLWAAELQQHPKNTASISYRIAGLMSTTYARSLTPDDPIDEVLTLAGELEVNPVNADKLQQELIDKIIAL